jgi:Sulfotransferase family
MAAPAAPITPIFIFSLPRCGSTLTQRMLATHPEVGTAGEPWLLLPFLYTRRRRGVYAEYAHRTVYRGIEEFCDGLPGGTSDYLREIREMALHLYRARAGESARFFVDKTPRYHVIASEIVKLFPDARFIFLWRSPLAVVSSLIETWGKGRWNIYHYEFDLYDGLTSLIQARELAGTHGFSLQFRDVVDKTSGAVARVFMYLGLEFDADRTSGFAAVQLPGGMWDPTGTRLYQELSQAPRERWKTTLASPLRKWWCRRYLRWIGKDRLAVMGYDLDQLLADLAGIPTRYKTVFSDIYRMLLGPAIRTFEPWIMRDKFSRLTHGERLYLMR